jgi:hypothetical protein
MKTREKRTTIFSEKFDHLRVISPREFLRGPRYATPVPKQDHLVRHAQGRSHVVGRHDDRETEVLVQADKEVFDPGEIQGIEPRKRLVA